jgi:hypothetical protein
MPILGTPDVLGFTTVTPFPRLKDERPPPTGDEIIRAAWENNNILGSTLNAVQNFQMPGQMDPELNLDEHLAGYEKHYKKFIGVRNVDDINQRKQRLEREAENADILQRASGLGDLVTSTVIGSLDPTWLIPGSFASTSALKTIQSSSLRALAGAAGGATAIGSTVALQEGILQATQLDRSTQESINNTIYAAAGGAILGGLMGYLTKAQKDAFNKAVIDAGTGDFTNPHAQPFMGPMHPVPNTESTTGALYRDLDRTLDPVTAQAVAPARVGDLKQKPGILNKVKDFLFNSLFDWTPQGQAARSNFETIQRLGPQIYHTDFLSNLHLEGKSLDAALETLIEVENAPLKTALRDALEEHIKYSERLASEGLTPLGREDFGRLVMDAHRRLDKHAIPEVQAAAGHLRKNYDRNFQRGIEVGFADKAPKTHTAESYAPRIINRLKVQVERFMTLARDGVSGPIERIVNHLEDVNERIKRGEKVYNRTGSDLMHQARLLRENAQDYLAKLGVKSGANKVKLKATEVAELQALIKEAAHLEAQAAEHVFAKLDPDSLTRKATEILDNYLNIDLHQETGHAFNQKYAPDSLKPGTFKAREFMIDDELFKDYWLDDAFEVSYRHHMSTSPYLTTAEFLKSSGYGSIENIYKELGSEYDKLRPHLSGKQAVKLDKEYLSAQRYIKDSFELMTGQFDKAIDHPGWRRLADVMNAYTSARLLGGTPLAALDDVGRVMFTRGLEAFFEDGIAPMMKALSDPKLDSRLWQDLNIATDSILGFTRNLGDDLHQLYGDRTAIERFVKFAGNDVHRLSGLQLQGRLLEEIYGRTSMSGNMRNIIGLLNGADLKALTPEAREFVKRAHAGDRLFSKSAWKIDAHGREMLAKLGFDKRDFAAYINNYVTAGGDIYEGAYLPWKHDWGNKRLQKNFMGAIHKDMTQTIIKPTKGDIPFWGHRKLGQTLLKIRTFQFAALNKTTIPLLQRRDAAVLGTLVNRMSFGLLSYAAASKARDPFAPLHDNWRDLSYEAIDRAALTGVLMEGYNMGAKMGLVEALSGGLLGKDEGTRYQSRGPISALVGPNIGLLEDITQTVRAVTRAYNDPDKPYSTNDAARAFHMLPLVRVWYFRYIMEQAVRGLSEKAGATPSPDRSTRRQ